MHKINCPVPMNMSLYENRKFLIALKQLEKCLQTNISAHAFYLHFFSCLAQRSFRLRKTQYFYGTLYEIEETLNISQYFHENVYEIKGI